MRRGHVLLTGLGAAVAILASGAAEAHTGGATGAGFGNGFSHPLSGLDHLLAMVAVGLWAAQLGGRAIWQVPAAFVAMLLVGGTLGLAGFALPAVEPGIMASLLVIGVLVALAVKMPVKAGMALVGLFALFHGHAHGTEMPAAAAPALYALGFALATTLLHAAGIGLGRVLGDRLSPVAPRLAGAAVAVSGLWAMLITL